MLAFLKNLPKKYLLLTGALLVALAAPRAAYGIAPFLAAIAGGALVIAIILVIQQFLVFIFSLLVGLFIIIIQVDLLEIFGIGTGVGFAVDTVWRLIRDLSNMFFIVVMVVIAFATMLKLEQYKWQRLLPKLVLMAILINFSKTISLIILDFGQLLMMTFVRAFKDIAVDNLITGLQITEMLDVAKGAGIIEGGMKLILAPLLSIIMVVIASIVMAVIAILLIARMAVIWVMVAISPAAYLMNVLDATKQHWSRWWGFYLKTVFLGPSLAFFLWFVFLFMNGTDYILPQSQLEKTIPGIDPSEEYAGNRASSPLSLANFGIAVALLVVGTGMAWKAADWGVGAAKFVGEGGWEFGKKQLLDFSTGESMPEGILRGVGKHVPWPGGNLADAMGPGLRQRLEKSKSPLAQRMGRAAGKVPSLRKTVGKAVGILDSSMKPAEDIRLEPAGKGKYNITVGLKDPRDFIRKNQADGRAKENLKKQYAKKKGIEADNVPKDVNFEYTGREDVLKRISPEYWKTVYPEKARREAEAAASAAEGSGAPAAPAGESTSGSAPTVPPTAAPTPAAPEGAGAPAATSTTPGKSGAGEALADDPKLRKTDLVYAARDAQKRMQKGEPAGRVYQTLEDNNPLREKVEAELETQRKEAGTLRAQKFTDEERKKAVADVKSKGDVEAGTWYMQLDKNNPLRGKVEDILEEQRMEEAKKKGYSSYQFSEDEALSRRGAIVKERATDNELTEAIEKDTIAKYQFTDAEKVNRQGQTFKRVVETENSTPNNEIYSKNEYEEKKEQRERIRKADMKEVTGVKRVVGDVKNGKFDSSAMALDLSQLSKNLTKKQSEDIGIPEGVDLAGMYLNDSAQIQALFQAIAANFGDSLKKSLGDISLDTFQNEIVKKLKGIQIINKGREGYDPRFVRTHEAIERNLKKLVASQDKIRFAFNTIQEYKGTKGEIARIQLLQDIKQQWHLSDSPEDTEKAMKEAVVTALTNEAGKGRGWKGEDTGIHLSPDAYKDLQEVMRVELRGNKKSD